MPKVNFFLASDGGLPEPFTDFWQTISYRVNGNSNNILLRFHPCDIKIIQNLIVSWTDVLILDSVCQSLRFSWFELLKFAKNKKPDILIFVAFPEIGKRPYFLAKKNGAFPLMRHGDFKNYLLSEVFQIVKNRVSSSHIHIIENRNTK